MPHKTSRVFINGSEVRVALNGIKIETLDADATRVTLELLPDEIRFVREPQGPSSEQVEAGEPEPKFEIGDRVYSHDHVKMGKVTERWDRHWYRVDFDDGHGAFMHQDRLAKASKPEPKPVVQAGWTLESRKRARTKRRAKKIMIHQMDGNPISSEPYTLNFDAREISPNLYRTLFGE